MTNAILAMISRFRNAIAPRVEHLVFVGINVGLPLFLAGLLLENAPLKQSGTPLINLAILLAIATGIPALQVATNDASTSPVLSGPVAHHASMLLALALLFAACTSDGDTPVGVPSNETARATAAAGPASVPSPSATTGAEGTRAGSPTPITTAGSATPPANANRPSPTSAGAPTPTGVATGPSGQTVGLDCVVPVLKRHPIDLAPYDSASGRAGDASFVRPLFLNRVYTEFGFVIPADTSSTGNNKPNPQPTYLAPMGTKVRSAVDGVVDRIADLWSTPTLGDVSVMVKPDGLPGRCYAVVEFEHVVKPTVRVGDRVTVGQVIAEVGPLNSQGSRGLGLVEFGILTGSPNGRPLHVCPYAYFDPAVRGTQLAILGRLMADWEAYFGDATLYNEAAWAGGVTGCRSGPIED